MEICRWSDLADNQGNWVTNQNDIHGEIDFLSYENRGFKSLYYRAASQTLTSGLTVQSLTSVMHGQLNCA
jgi:hypothetical protein